MTTEFTDQYLRFYKKNFAFLKAKFPSIASLINPTLSSNIKLEESKTSEPTLKYKGILLLIIDRFNCTHEWTWHAPIKDTTF